MATFTEQLKQRAINFIGGRTYQERQRQTAALLDHAYRQGPALVPTASLIRQLGEIDTRLLDLFIQQAGYQMIGGQFTLGKLSLTEQDRLRVVEQSRYYYHFDTQFENAVSMWTDFGFGQQVVITPLDDAANEIWEECWTARRNSPLFKQRNLHTLSDGVTVDGEIFFVAWASTVDGLVTWRRFDTDEVKEIVYDQDDDDIPMFYVVETGEGELYFPDWQPTDEELNEEWAKILKDKPQAKRADQMSGAVELNGESTPRTDVKVIHAALNKKGGRGWPKFYRGIDWMESLRTHIGDHLAVAKAVATFVDEIITKSGSRGVDSIAAKFASTLSTGSGYMERNPVPAAGAVLTHNEAIDVERRPLTTAAGDAETTTGLIVAQASSSTKVPGHWMGFAQMMQNRAVARETNRPFVQQMERYQEFWADVFGDMVKVTLLFAVKYGKYSEGSFETTDADITFESPQLIDAAEIAAIVKALSDAAGAGMMDANIARHALDWLAELALVSLGARNVRAILEPPEEEEEEETPPGPEGTEEEPSAQQAGAGAETTTEQLAAVIRQNARDGCIDWQTVAEWALGEAVSGS